MPSTGPSRTPARSFAQELPAVRAWSFGPDDAARVRQPVLAVLGGGSAAVSPVFEQRHRLLLDWLPDARPFVLPGATHLLHVDDPAGMATALARFLADVAAAEGHAVGEASSR